MFITSWKYEPALRGAKLVVTTSIPGGKLAQTNNTYGEVNSSISKLEGKCQHSLTIIAVQIRVTMHHN